MKRFRYFIKSLFPVVMVFILQIVAAIPTMLFFLFRASGDAKPALNELLASLSGLTSDMEYLQTLNLVYAILALLVFGTWYYKIFVKPFRHRRKKIIRQDTVFIPLHPCFFSALDCNMSQPC